MTQKPTQEELIAMADKLISEDEARRRKPYVVLSTKVSVEDAQDFKEVNRIDGVTDYDKLQELVVSYTHIKKSRGVLNAVQKKLIAIFNMGVHLKNAFHLGDMGVDNEILEATYFVGSPKDKQGMKALHVFRQFLGDAEVTTNPLEVVDLTLRVCLPTWYEQMQKEVSRRHMNSVPELMVAMAEEAMDVEINEEFEERYDTKMENGREMADGPYRRTMCPDMDSRVAQIDKRVEEWNRKHPQMSLWSEDDQIGETF